MKEHAVELAQNEGSPADKLNILREYLQAFVMRSLHESEAYTCLSFVGGTALRFAFDLPRFSEDLDFSLENPAGYEPVRWMEKLKRDMILSGFDIAISWNDRKTVHTAWIKVAGYVVRSVERYQSIERAKIARIVKVRKIKGRKGSYEHHVRRKNDISLAHMKTIERL